jgi:hypothetical protein
MNNGKPGVLLINPTFNVHEHYGKLSDAASLLLPVSLLYLGGMLEAKGIPVRILDGQCDDLSEGALLKAIDDMKPAFVGITMHTDLLRRSQDRVDCEEPSSQHVGPGGWNASHGSSGRSHGRSQHRCHRNQ